jgi:hypothetical protein
MTELTAFVGVSRGTLANAPGRNSIILPLPRPGRARITATKGTGVIITKAQVIRQAYREGTALSGGSAVVTQDAPEAFPTMHFADGTPDLGARVDEAIGSPPGRRSGVARAGGRSSWWTRCGCGDKHSFGPGRRAVKRLNGPMAMMPQASSAWAFAVGLSILTLRVS